MVQLLLIMFAPPAAVFVLGMALRLLFDEDSKPYHWLSGGICLFPMLYFAALMLWAMGSVFADMWFH